MLVAKLRQTTTLRQDVGVASETAVIDMHFCGVAADATSYSFSTATSSSTSPSYSVAGCGTAKPYQAYPTDGKRFPRIAMKPEPNGVEKMESPNHVATELARVLSERFGHEVNVPDAIQNEVGLVELLRMATYASHREWSQKPVSPQLVRMLAACALCAPSKSFLQQCDVVHVCDVAQRANINALIPSLPWVADAPVLLIFCGDGQRFKHLFDRKKLPFPNDHLDAFFNATVDAALVLMAYIRAAAAAGLVGCPISLVRNMPYEIEKLLKLPDRVFPVAGLCLGYPRNSCDVKPRLSLDATFHVDRFRGANDDAGVDDFDRRYVLAKLATSEATPCPKSWSEERVTQYSSPQRVDWGEFIESKKFILS